MVARATGEFRLFQSNAGFVNCSLSCQREIGAGYWILDGEFSVFNTPLIVCSKKFGQKPGAENNFEKYLADCH